ncbi:DNA polymerase IV [Aedoeadaptatus ivorii]|uniref:DNA polymerase IV n=1 Tax=Aedoeadaptatus ivorii TaxID=54006 RepID=A0A3S4ZRK0_9FIRM|nr:DNA polymerase IV [Peptoniphilus ivorii]VEJ36242.1 DNA polymerase IV [Peptoniphilus ivorii]
MERVILHSDMNNCYASIEAMHNPSLKGKPIVVGGSEAQRHGIVLAKSQEAKAFGVKTGEALWQARQKCPNLIVVAPHYEWYLDASRKARAIYYDYTNQVEPFGLDECWLDVTGSQHLFGTGEEIAHTIRKRIKREMGITVSVGVSFTKTFAKLGSDLKKPDAVTVISRINYPLTVRPLAVDAMIGIGRKTKEKLNRIGIFTLGDLADTSPHILQKRLGIVGVALWKKASGLEDAAVADRDARVPVKSVGKGSTLPADLVRPVEVRRIFQILSTSVSRRLREYGLRARSVEVHVRDNALLSRSFQGPLPYPGQAAALLSDGAYALFQKKYEWDKPVRALTLRAIDLSPETEALQTDFFSCWELRRNEENLDRALHSIRARWGKDAVGYCGASCMALSAHAESEFMPWSHGI